MYLTLRTNGYLHLIPTLIFLHLCVSFPVVLSYPAYDQYVIDVEKQKQREHAVSFLSATEAKKFIASEEAEEAEAALEAHISGAKPSSASSSAPAASSSSSSSSTTPAAYRDLKALENTCWVKSKVLSYLSSTPAATQSSESSAEFLRASKALLADRAKENKAKEEDTRLTVCELIQLLNLRPASLVEIHRAIEECEERFSEEDTLALLELIDKTLPAAPPRAVSNAGAEAAPEGGAEEDVQMEDGAQ